MNMKKILAAAAASALSLSCLAVMSSSAAEKAISYTQSDAATNVGDNGQDLRVNMKNEWQNDVDDINAASCAVSGYISVEFEVSGIGDASTNSDGDQLVAYVAGQVGTLPSVFNAAAAGDDVININGDGTYTATWHFPDMEVDGATVTGASESVTILFLQTNINVYDYSEGGAGLGDTTAKLTVKSIKTDDGVPAEEPSTEATTEATTSASTSASTSGSTSGKKDSSTTSASTSKASDSETAAKTGDAGIAVAVAALGVACATAFVVRKKD